jgi:hypothetical protein
MASIRSRYAGDCAAVEWKEGWYHENSSYETEHEKQETREEVRRIRTGQGSITYVEV